MANDAVIVATKNVIDLLVRKDYREVERLSLGERLTAEEIGKAISDYGRTLVVPPDEAYQLLDAVRIRGSDPRKWSVTMPFWTEEEGRSDLSLELTITEGPRGGTVEVDDIHVF